MVYVPGLPFRRRSARADSAHAKRPCSRAAENRSFSSVRAAQRAGAPGSPALLQTLFEQVLIQIATEKRETQQLEEQAGEGVVCVLSKIEMLLRPLPCPTQQFSMFRSAERFSKGRKAFLVVVIPDVEVGI